MEGLKVSDLKPGKIYWCQLSDRKVLYAGNSNIWFWNYDTSAYQQAVCRDGQLKEVEGTPVNSGYTYTFGDCGNCNCGNSNTPIVRTDCSGVDWGVKTMSSQRKVTDLGLTELIKLREVVLNMCSFLDCSNHEEMKPYAEKLKMIDTELMKYE